MVFKYKLPQEFRKYNHNKNQLKVIFKDTQRILELISLENFFAGENILDELLPTLTLDKICHGIENYPAIVVFGQNNRSKSAIVNSLLSSDVLPYFSGLWRWVKISYGPINHISLSLGLEYEVVENLRANEISWKTVPIEDLRDTGNSDFTCPAILEIKLNHIVLKENVQIFIAPNNRAVKVLDKGIFRILPIFIYALGDGILSKDNIQELRDLKETYPYTSVLFVNTVNDPFINSSAINSNLKDVNCLHGNGISIKTWLNQLKSCGFSEYENSNNAIFSIANTDCILDFIKTSLQNYLIDTSNCLNEVHTKSLRKFILSAFDMAREIQITPKRILYAQEKENDLYDNLINAVSANQNELTELISKAIQEIKEELMTAPDDLSLLYENMYYERNGDRSEWCATVRSATRELQRLILIRLGDRVAKEMAQSIKCLQETFIGTLQRCLVSLEKCCENENTPVTASDALKQILSVTYNLELHKSSPSLLHSFAERLRQLFKSFSLPWNLTPVLDTAWKKKVSLDVLNSLNPARLAKAMSTQFCDKVKASHDSFQSALRSLENHYSGRLERTEEQRIAIRKYHAPKLAKLALESTSMCDMIRFGIPMQGKEIGRGQYGVVFACDGWGFAPGPFAVKSVVPPDERHWNDLAMEVYYTRSIPDHSRIVKLRGTVIDHSYGGGYGCGAAVLLISDRLCRDLFCGLKAGLCWPERIQIAIDVLEGIRYLHSQGLVHRDIKLKNVLLDEENRAKLTDLGFCITEAMISGSIVGTPVHMAPELLSGHYDSSVDIYAFGILFWYLCAGHVRFPYAFEQFQNKEQLWTSVKRGTRPERLISFDDECWKLMEQCWSGDPARRPLLGVILPILKSIQEKTELNNLPEEVNEIKVETSYKSIKKNNFLSANLVSKRKGLQTIKPLLQNDASAFIEMREQ